MLVKKNLLRAAIKDQKDPKGPKNIKIFPDLKR